MDELHRAKSAALYGVFRDGLGPRGGQMLAISVAGDHEQTPLGMMRSSARRLPIQRRKGAYRYSRSEDGAFALHEWSLDQEDDLDDMKSVKRANPASWQTLDRLRARHDSPSMLPWQWARFACGIWIGAESWWLSADDWNASELANERIELGAQVTLGFDGARSGDATALVACRVSDGLLQPLAVFEPPADGRPWEISTDEVDRAVSEAMEEFHVIRGYFDPPLWQSEIDGWAREYGETAVMRYPTNRTRMQGATERFRTDLVAGRVLHSGDETLTRHVLNAQIREARGGYWLTKNRPGSQEKIDAAVAAVLAYEARADALSAGDDKRKRRDARLLSF
jgi:phage terminase large subunit-like protein